MNARIRYRTNELTLLAVLATVVMLFAAFSSAYLIRRSGADWQRVSIPEVMWLNALVVAASSVTLEIARRRGMAWFAATLGLGLLFLVGQIAGWQALASRGLFMPTNPHAAFVYMLSAVHGLHLLGGLVALAYTMRRPEVLGLCAVYWHFVGGVWLYLLAMLQLA